MASKLHGVAPTSHSSYSHPHRHFQPIVRCSASTTPQAAASAVSSRRFLQWLSDNGATQKNSTLLTVSKSGVDVDVTVATHTLSPGDLAFSIPERLIVTLDSVFEDGGLAELLTTNKLSELACLALYLMYEKKKGKESFWYPFIKELDAMAGRGPQGAKSPLLWNEGEVDELLAGSPVIAQIKQRLEGIEREYNELDTVWYMAGSLFNKYPFDVPSEQFSKQRFIQAFAAIQSCVVHLQGVPLSKRFALVPMGPPLLSYSSTAKCMIKYNAETERVELVVDREYNINDPILAWCGPQPNSRLLINYGIVDPFNPYDKLPLGITIPSEDPLYRQKRATLGDCDLSTQQTFQMSAAAGQNPLPKELIPYLRLTYAKTVEELEKVVFDEGATPISLENERQALGRLVGVLKQRLSGYRTTIEEDEATIADCTIKPRRCVASRLLKIEKTILKAALDQVQREAAANGVENLENVDIDDGIKFTS